MARLQSQASVDNFTITSLDSLTWSDYEGNLEFVLDELQTATISNTEETTNVTGKNGRTLDKLKRNKAVSITGTNGYMDTGMMAVQTGGVHEYLEEYEVDVNESIQLTDATTATLSRKAFGPSGAEIRTIVRETLGGTLDTLHQLKQGAVAGPGVFTYDPLTKTLTFAEDEFTAGDMIRVFYAYKVPVTRVDNPTDSYSRQGRCVIDCSVRDKCGKDYHAQILIPKADMTGNFDFTFGDEQATHSFTIDALASVNNCDATTFGKKNIFWDLVIFGMDSLQETDEEDEPNPDEPGGDEPVTPPATVNKDALTALITSATTAKDGATVSVDGSDVATTSKWVAQSDVDTLAGAITTAQAVADKTDATQTEVDDAVTALQAAVAAFEAAKQDGTQV